MKVSFRHLCAAIWSVTEAMSGFRSFLSLAFLSIVEKWRHRNWGGGSTGREANMGQELTKLSPEELKARQIKEMDAELKQKLQRGANYNSKCEDETYLMPSLCPPPSLKRRRRGRGRRRRRKVATLYNTAQHNAVKVVIKGDKNTGKTCLWRRLQRMAFLEDYHGTDQIQIATIPWDYKGEPSSCLLLLVC